MGILGILGYRRINNLRIVKAGRCFESRRPRHSFQPVTKRELTRQKGRASFCVSGDFFKPLGLLAGAGRRKTVRAGRSGKALPHQT